MSCFRRWLNFVKNCLFSFLFPYFTTFSKKNSKFSSLSDLDKELEDIEAKRDAPQNGEMLFNFSPRSLLFVFHFVHNGNNVTLTVKTGTWIMGGHQIEKMWQANISIVSY